MTTIKIKNSIDNSWIDLPGIPGKSAYVIAVENGYTGTETEFGTYLKNSAETNLNELKINVNSIENLTNTTFKQKIIDDILDGVVPKYLTQAEYDLLTDEEKNKTNVIYTITDKTYDKAFPFNILSSEAATIGV